MSTETTDETAAPAKTSNADVLLRSAIVVWVFLGAFYFLFEFDHLNTGLMSFWLVVQAGLSVASLIVSVRRRR